MVVVIRSICVISSVVFLKESKKKWLMIYIMFLFPCGGQSPDSRGGSARLWSRIRFSCRRLVFCANNDYRHKSFFLFTVPLFINSAIRCFNNPRLLSQPFLSHLLTTVIIAFPFLQSVKSCETKLELFIQSVQHTVSHRTVAQCYITTKESEQRAPSQARSFWMCLVSSM